MKNIIEKIHLVVCVFFAVLAMSVQGAVYVSPTGAGNKDGSNAENAYDVASLQTAMTTAAAQEDKTVYLAPGLYYTPEDTMTQPGINVPEGVSVIGSTNELGEVTTILCGDVNGDDVWDTFDFEDYLTKATNGVSYSRQATTIPVVKDGRINLPDDDDKKMYFARHEMRKDNRKRCLFLQKGSQTLTRRIENLTITGYGISDDTGYVYGCAVYVEGSGNGGTTDDKDITTFRNVHAIGNHVGIGAIITYRTSVLLDCSISRNGVKRGAYTSRAPDTLENCRFVSNFRVDGPYSTSVYLWWSGATTTLSNCWFELNYSAGSNDSYDPSPCIASESSTNPLIMDCTFTNNLSAHIVNASCINAKRASWRILGCRMVGNRQVVSGDTDANLGICVKVANAGTVIEGCTFADNHAYYRSSGASQKTIVSAPVLTYSVSKTTDVAARSEIVNSLFYDNSFTLVGTAANTEKVTTHPARAIGLHAQSSVGNASIGVSHCTFAGSGTDPDIVVCGAREGNESSTIIDSVFTGPGGSTYRPLDALNNQPVDFKRNTTAGIFTYNDSVTTSDLTTDDPLVVLPSGEMSARTENRRTTEPLSWFESGSVRYFVRETSDGAVHLNPAYTVAIPNSRTAIGDIAGVVRPATGETAALRGARETMDAATADKKTLIYRIEPVGSATLNGRTGVTELLADDDASTAISTIEMLEGVTFKAWKNSVDGRELSNNINWRPTELTEDTTIIAVFSAPKTTYTFSLGESGTFVENNQSTITVPYDVGAVPSFPAYAFDDEHYVDRGWDKPLPAAVGSDPLTFTLKYMERKYRIVRYDSNVSEGGTGDGSTWANAMTDLQAALDLAGVSGGEVRVKKGVHKPIGVKGAPGLVSYSNVKLLGGFDGETYATDEAELAERDIVRNVTIFSGDVSGDDYWNGCPLTSDGNLLDNGALVPVLDTDGNNLTVLSADGKLNACNPNNTHRYWYVANTKEDNVGQLFDFVDAKVDETCVIDGITFASFVIGEEPLNGRDDACLSFGSEAHPTILNCSFTSGDYYIYSDSYATISNCCFRSGRWGICTSTTGPWDEKRLQIYDTTFDNMVIPWVSYLAPLAVHGGNVDVRHCVFRRNYLGNARNHCTSPTIAVNGNAKVYVYDSLFESNVATNTEASCDANILYGEIAMFSNCVVRLNEAGLAGTRSASIFNLSASGCHVFDSSIYSNKVALASTLTSGFASASVASISSQGFGLVNSTVAENEVSVTVSDGVEAIASTMKFSNHAYGSMVNSTFANNTGVNTEFLGFKRIDNFNRPLHLVNVIAVNPNGNYLRVIAPDSETTTGFKVYESTLHGIDTSGIEDTTLTVASGLLADDPGLRPAKYEASGHVRLPVGAISSSARSGRNVYWSEASQCLALNTAAKGEKENWINLTSLYGTPSQPFTLLADALGRPRRDGKVTRGALEADPAGFRLIIR